MSKRRRKKQNKPNLPEATLERARRQAAVERGELDAEDVEEIEEAAATEAPSKAESVTNGSADTGANPFKTVSAKERRARTGTHTGEDGTVRRKRREGPVVRARKDAENLDHETIVHLLHNPTKTVSPDELRQEYGYVLADLRSMGGLAAGLIVTLIVLAVIFV